MKVKMIAKTSEASENITNDVLTNEILEMSGSFAGMCYSADGYVPLSNDEEKRSKSVKRAKATAQRGHHSVFGHCSIVLELECSKMIAMLLNSVGISNTSEKSARYTVMKPETTIEREMYEKWHNKFSILISAKYGDILTENEIDKLANENARYCISVFTPTHMIYTIPYRQAMYIISWIDGMNKVIVSSSNAFEHRLALELKELKSYLLEIVGDVPIFEDNKNEYFRFMPAQATGKYECHENYIGDVYTVNYKASFAAVAQIQRHRTTRVKINFNPNPHSLEVYVPKILEDDDIACEWKRDMHKLISNGVYPQGILLEVVEQGLCEDFVLKCKERMCGRTQLETMDVTAALVQQFYDAVTNSASRFSSQNIERIKNIVYNDKPCARCMYADFKCTEGCKWGAKNAIDRLI